MLLGVLLASIIVICIAMVAIILLQKSEGGALGMSGGGPGNFMTARGTGDLLTRATQVLAALFFGLCLVMTLLSGHNHGASSIADRMKIGGITPPPAPAAPASSSASAPISAPVSAAPSAVPAEPAAPTGSTGLFGETRGPARAKPATGPVNPLANITVQSSAPPASR
jgi:preprotein translocase subunit SecG